jgi:hypothetical protein
MKFMVQFINFCLGLVQGLLANRCDPVDPSLTASYILQNRLQQPTTLQTMQEGVERSWTNAISVMLQLVHHRQPKDRLVRSMYQHVNSYEPEKQLPLLFQHKINIPLLSEYEFILSNFDISYLGQ